MERCSSFCLILLILSVAVSANGHEGLFVHFTRNRRGFGELFNNDMFKNSRQAAVAEINGNQNIALLSAQAAVKSSNGESYGQLMGSLAHSVQQYVTPMKMSNKSQHIGYPDKEQNLPEKHQSETTINKHTNNVHRPTPNKRNQVDNQMVKKRASSKPTNSWVGINRPSSRRHNRRQSIPNKMQSTKQKCKNN